MCLVLFHVHRNILGYKSLTLTLSYTELDWLLAAVDTRESLDSPDWRSSRDPPWFLDRVPDPKIEYIYQLFQIGNYLNYEDVLSNNVWTRGLSLNNSFTFTLFLAERFLTRWTALACLWGGVTWVYWLHNNIKRNSNEKLN